MAFPEPQPAKGILALRRITNRQVAQHLGVTPEWVGRVLNGYARPPDRFRAAVSELTGAPEAELFRVEP
jgi:transcriptional regulator with XRE-family HTH domain